MTAYVYSFWADETCLYVGCTQRIGPRITRHSSERPWFGEVTRIDVDAFPSIEDALLVEEARIRALQPLHNRVFTAHEVFRRLPCRTCHQGAHGRCVGVNSRGEVCPCGVCARQAVTA